MKTTITEERITSMFKMAKENNITTADKEKNSLNEAIEAVLSTTKPSKTLR